MKRGAGQDDFNAAASKDEVKAFLEKCGVAYVTTHEGLIVLPDGLYLGDRGISSMPDMTRRVVVRGDINLYDNNFPDLKHIPQTFDVLHSDFGVFNRFIDIPKELRAKPLKNPLPVPPLPSKPRPTAARARTAQGVTITFKL